MGKTLYIDCSGGIAGDMFAGALIGLGGDTEAMNRAVESIKGHHVEGFDIKIGTRIRSGIKCTDFDVVPDKEHDGHDHDMEYLHGHNHDHDHEHEHGGHHHHDARNLHDILHIIEHADMTDAAKSLASRIFTILAEAESEAHGIDVSEVHFHEVGAVDSIADVICASVLFDSLGFDKVIVTELTEGRGMVRCQHGVLSVPVPAVTNIVSRYEIALHVSDVRGELVTPTGAAIVAAVRTSSELPRSFRIVRSGLGAGKRDYDAPGFVRASEIIEI